MQTRSLRTRVMAASAGLALTLAACGGGDDDAATTDIAAEGGGATETTELTLMMFPGQGYRVPVAVAREQGYFEEAGIEINIVDQPANLQGMQGLAATGADIGILSTATLTQGFQAGSEGVFFCGSLDYLQTSLIAPVGSDLPSTAEGADPQEVLQALEGKTIGVQTPVGSGLQLIFAEALAQAGVENVTYVNAGGGLSVAQAALQNGSVDVVQANPPGTQVLTEGDIGEEIIYMPEGSDTYEQVYGSAWVAPEAFLEEQPEAAAAFCDAIEMALEFILDPANEETVVESISAETGVEPAVAELVIPTFEDYSTEIDRNQLQETFDLFVELGVNEPTPEMTVEELVVTPGS